jgi:hypothetical protein
MGGDKRSSNQTLDYRLSIEIERGFRACSDITDGLLYFSPTRDSAWKVETLELNQPPSTNATSNEDTKKSRTLSDLALRPTLRPGLGSTQGRLLMLFKKGVGVEEWAKRDLVDGGREHKIDDSALQAEWPQRQVPNLRKQAHRMINF